MGAIRASANHIEEVLTVEYGEHRDKFFETLMVEGKSLHFEIDSGAAVSIVSTSTVRTFFPHRRLKATTVQLMAFCTTPIEVVGMLPVSVAWRGGIHKLNLYVSKVQREPLLGREWIRQLQLFQLTDTINLVTQNDTRARIAKLLQRYRDKLDTGSTKIQDLQASLVTKENVKPVFLKARTVPFRLLPLVEQEIQTLVKDGILEKVNTSRWATPIVPVLKENNRVRICGDFSVTINPNLLIDEHPLPTIDELFASMAGGIKFTKIDLHQAYLQLEIREEDRELLTLSTHKGLYWSTRLMYGIASAPAIWQREIENILRDIPGVSIFIDDIKITGPDEETHLYRLEQVLADANIRINEEKSEFLKEDIHYCGYRVDKQGIHKMTEKVQAINQMPRPSSVTELRAFLGMVNYYGRFIKDLSTILAPLHALLQKGVPYKWMQNCERAFQSAKDGFKSDTVLVHFDQRLPLILATDASPYGAVLSHRYPDGTERVLQFASQTLTGTQRKYAQIDKEAYAIIFGIKKFHQYLYGKKFTLYTDHRPLVQIFSQSKALPAYTALRMQHYAVFLQGYLFDIKYKNTKQHCNADCLSRLPVSVTTTAECDVVDVYETEVLESVSVSTDQIAQATRKDVQLREIISELQKKKEVLAKLRFNINQAAFSIQQGILLCNGKVVIPKLLQKRFLRDLHKSHFGVAKMKGLARTMYWWPGIDKAIENMARHCGICNSMRNDPPKVGTHEWEAAEAPFERVHIDYAGPFMNAYLLVLVDAFSKWPFVHIVKNITAKTTIHKCKIFSEFGSPKIIVMDNGRNFRSAEFQQFLKANDITPKFIAPYHPSTNGQAERFIQTMKNSLRKMLTDPRNKNLNLESALHEFLVQYRVTPHCVTGVTPSKKMFNRKIHTSYTACVPSKTKTSIDINANKKLREFVAGESVQCRNYSGDVKWKHGRIIQRMGKLHYKVKINDGRVLERHADQILRSGEYWDNPEEPQVEAEPNDPGMQGGAEGPQDNEEVAVGLQPEPEEIRPPRVEETEPPVPAPVRQEARPRRNRRPPTRYTDFRCDWE